MPPNSSGAGRESELVRQVLDYLQIRRIPATRNQSGRVRVGRNWVHLSPEGWPDVIACWRGRFLGIEVKRPGEELRTAQESRHRELSGAGAIIMTVHSLDDLEEALREPGGAGGPGSGFKSLSG